MNILCIGDVVGKPGRRALLLLLPALIEKYKLDFIITNAENVAGGSGLTSRLAKKLLESGSDVLTLGDHVWDQKELEEYLNQSKNVIRPANFPEEAPGKGCSIINTKKGSKIAVINLLGRVFMRYQVDCPFRTFDKIYEEVKNITPFIVVDLHAEATSEKVAFGHYVNGRASVVFGTHTHIQTADETILSKGTGYITDLGMTGPFDSVIGQNKENIIKRFLYSMPVKFSVAEGQVKLQGIVVEIDDKTGKTKNILRIQVPVDVSQNNNSEEIEADNLA